MAMLSYVSMLICLAVANSAIIQDPCHQGESFWCQNEETAIQCGVQAYCRLQKEQQQKGSKTVADAQPVVFELYYESQCGGCRDMIKQQIWPTYQTLYSTGIIQIGLYPYGNAHETQLPNGTWAFDCQHGEVECQMNLVETCAIHLLHDQAAFMPFIHCLEESGPNMANARACAGATKVDFDKILLCATSSMGNKYEHEFAVKTNNLTPKHGFVPWVTLNGQHTWQIQDRAGDDLIGLICDTYTGTKPHACRVHQNSRKENRCYK